MAEDEWTKVIERARRQGFRASDVFENPATTAAVRSVGWERICHSEAVHFERRAFLDAYAGYSGRETEARQIGALPSGRVPARLGRPASAADVVALLPKVSK